MLKRPETKNQKRVPTPPTTNHLREFLRSFRQNVIAVNRSVYAGETGSLHLSRTDFDHFKLCGILSIRVEYTAHTHSQWVLVSVVLAGFI